MYASMVSFVVKAFRISDFRDSVDKAVKYDIATQPGFIGYFVLDSEREMRLATTISLWQTASDRDDYLEKIFPLLVSKLEPVIDAGPFVQHCTADLLESHRLPTGVKQPLQGIAGKAA